MRMMFYAFIKIYFLYEVILKLINILKINELNLVVIVFNRINLAIVEFFDSKLDANVDFSNFGYINFK